MKILHGMAEIAGQGINTVEGLRENGYNATMAVRNLNPLIGQTDINLNLLGVGHGKMAVISDTIRMIKFAVKALKTYDVFHCHFAYTLLPRGWDAYLFRLCGIRCFAEFHGTDLRFIYHPDIEYTFYKTNVPEKKVIAKTRKKLNRLLKHVEGVIVHDYELLPHIPDLNKPVYIVPLRVDIKSIKPCPPEENNEKIPVIVHAPSNRGKKGTEQILKVLSEIEDEFRLVLVENMSHDEAMEVYRDADIIIDQVAIGTYGVLCIEAMALGKPVVSYISPENMEKLPKSLPIINADFDTMAEQVKRLIRDPKLRHETGVKGRAYVERYHDNVNVAALLYDIYDGKNSDNNLFNLL